ncbi:MAG TPA: hypothetical protein VJ955_05130, partial [Desulfuromonadales bacterium]|nr:hypothetical protein [Desulfuromonadales bacterium]
MGDVLGLVIALPEEARALLGKRRWQDRAGRRILSQPLPDGARLLCVQAGVGSQRAESAARWLLAQGVGALGVAG